MGKISGLFWARLWTLMKEISWHSTQYVEFCYWGSISISRNICGPRNSLINFTFILPCIVIDFFLNNQTDALIIQIYSVIKRYMFRASSLPIISSSVLYIRHCSILNLLGSGHQKTCVKLTSDECTVQNSWWWAEKMPETCRFYNRINSDN
jgi:hypothetical protein